jgi:hypothetical protein
MSEASNRRVVSFAQDIIYDVIRCKVKTPKRVGLAVLADDTGCLFVFYLQNKNNRSS